MDQHEPGKLEHEQELVAYLDGELDADESRRVERLIADNPAARAQLNEFERTWSALDSLPRASVDDSFTRSTVEMIAVSEQNQLANGTATETRAPSRAGLFTAAGVLVMGVVGFLAAGVFVPDPNDRLLAELPIFEHLDSYVETENADFLKALYASRAFEEPLDGETEAALPKSVADDPAQRREYIAALSADSKQQLVRNFNRFATLTDDEQERVRSLYEAIDVDADAEELQVVMHRYHEWLKDLPTVDRANLRTLEDADRVAKIQEIRDEEKERIARILPVQDEQAFREWVFRRMNENMAPHVKKMWEQAADEDERLELVRGAISRYRPKPEFGTWKLQGPGDEEVEKLLATLSKEGKKKLQTVMDDREARTELLRQWTLDLIPSYLRGWSSSRRSWRPPSDDERREIVSELTESQKNHLLGQPGEYIDNYLRSRNRGGGPGPGGGFGPPPGMRGGPGDGRNRGNGPPPRLGGGGPRSRRPESPNGQEGEPRPPR